MKWLPKAIECVRSKTINQIALGCKLRELREDLSNGREFSQSEQERFVELLQEMRKHELLPVLWRCVYVSTLASAPIEAPESIRVLVKLCQPFAPQDTTREPQASEASPDAAKQISNTYATEIANFGSDIEPTTPPQVRSTTADDIENESRTSEIVDDGMDVDLAHHDSTGDGTTFESMSPEPVSDVMDVEPAHPDTMSGGKMAEFSTPGIVIDAMDVETAHVHTLIDGTMAERTTNKLGMDDDMDLEREHGDTVNKGTTIDSMSPEIISDRMDLEPVQPKATNNGTTVRDATPEMVNDGMDDETSTTSTSIINDGQDTESESIGTEPTSRQPSPAKSKTMVQRKGSGWFEAALTILAHNSKCMKYLEWVKGVLKLTKARNENQLAWRVAGLIIALKYAAEPWADTDRIDHLGETVKACFKWLNAASAWSRWDTREEALEDPEEFLQFLLSSACFPFDEMGRNFEFLRVIQMTCLKCGEGTWEARLGHILRVDVVDESIKLLDLIVQQCATPELQDGFCKQCANVEPHISLDTIRHNGRGHGLLLYIAGAEASNKVTRIDIPTAPFFIPFLSPIEPNSNDFSKAGLFFVRAISQCHEGSDGMVWMSYVRDGPHRKFQGVYPGSHHVEKAIEHVPSTSATLIYLEPCGLPPPAPPILREKVIQDVEQHLARDCEAQFDDIIPYLLPLVLPALRDFVEGMEFAVSGLLNPVRRLVRKMAPRNESETSASTVDAFAELFLRAIVQGVEGTGESWDAITAWFQSEHFKDGFHNYVNVHLQWLWTTFDRRLKKACDSGLHSLRQQYASDASASSGSFPSLHFFREFQDDEHRLTAHPSQRIPSAPFNRDDLLRKGVITKSPAWFYSDDEDETSLSDGYDDWACSIIGEGASNYLCKWEDDEETGRRFRPTWEPKENASEAAIEDWEDRKGRPGHG